MELYDIATRHREVLAAIDAADGELDDALEQRFDAVSGDLATKAESIAALIRELDADASAIHDEERRLTARRKSVEARALRIREYLRAEMERADVPVVKGRLLSVRRQLGPVRVVVDAEHLDTALAGWGVAQAPKLDKKALRTALEAGDDVAGMIATLERTERVVIR